MTKKKGSSSSSSTSTFFNNFPRHDNAGPTDDEVSGENTTTHQCASCSRSFSSSQALGGHQNAHRHSRHSVRRELLVVKRSRIRAHHSSSPSPSHHQTPYNSLIPNVQSALAPPTLHGLSHFGGFGPYGGGDNPTFVDSQQIIPMYYGLDRHRHHHHHHRVHAYGPIYDYHQYLWSTYYNARSAQQSMAMQERVWPAWLTVDHQNRVGAQMWSTVNAVDQLASGNHHQPLIEYVRSDDEVDQSGPGDGGLDLTLKL